MTKNLYEGVLRFYPAAYREAFSREMIETYERAAVESANRGVLAELLFSLRELLGLTAGVLFEWGGKLAAPEKYVTSRCHVRDGSDLPPQIVEVRSEIDRLIRSMEFAIAHHDFRKARFYSDEERVTRRKLEHLLSEYGMSSSSALV